MPCEMGEWLLESLTGKEVPEHMTEDAARGGELVDPDDPAVAAMSPTVALGLGDVADAAIKTDGDDLAIVSDRGEAADGDMPADVLVEVADRDVTQVRKVLLEHGPILGDPRGHSRDHLTPSAHALSVAPPKAKLPRLRARTMTETSRTGFDSMGRRFQERLKTSVRSRRRGKV